MPKLVLKKNFKMPNSNLNPNSAFTVVHAVKGLSVAFRLSLYLKERRIYMLHNFGSAFCITLKRFGENYSIMKYSTFVRIMSRNFLTPYIFTQSTCKHDIMRNYYGANNVYLHI